MSIRFKRASDTKITFVSCSGKVVLDDMLGTFAKYVASGPHLPHCLAVDLSHVTEIDLSFRDIFKMVSFVRTVLSGPSARFYVAIYVPEGRNAAIAHAFAKAALIDKRLRISVHETWDAATDAAKRVA